MGVLSKTTSEIEDALRKADDIEVAFDTMFNQKMLSIYPVGAIYMSVSSASPASLFGGTWEQIQNRFLLAAGSSYTAGDTGGEATHTLTEDEMPAHTHTSTVYGISSGSYTANSARLVYKDNTTTGWISDGLSWVNSTGGSQSHNNMPPYLAVYVWKRTA